MSRVVTCPQCQTPIEVPGDLADQPIQCHRCMTVFERGKAVASVAVHAGPAPTVAPSSRAPEPTLSPPHREARAPFPWIPLLVLLLGILFFLLVASVGFNVYVMVIPEQGFRFNENVRRAEQVAAEQRLAAQQAMQAADANKKQADLNQARMQKQLEDLRRERDEALEKLRLLGKGAK
jgi:predicted  nucleic acid-binding Zn-ribbon protein